MRLGKKSLAALLALAMLLGTVPAALAAERTVYLEGYSIQEADGKPEVVEVTEGGQLSLKGDLTRSGVVELRDFADSAEVYTCPVYTAKGPVEVVVNDGYVEGDPTSGVDEDGDVWAALSLAVAGIDTVTYDAEKKSAETVKEDALYFDGKITYFEDDSENGKTVTLKEFYENPDIWDKVSTPPSIHKGAKATLTEPGTYRVYAYYEALEGGCIAFVNIPGAQTPAEQTPAEPEKPAEPETPATVNPFTDVAETSPFYKAILWAVDQKITAGTSADTFSPANPCTRAQILTFLWRAAGSPEPASQESPYSDVVSGSINGDFYKAILWAAEKGIADKGETFGPNEPCTRASTVVYLWKYAESPEVKTEKTFTDVATDAGYAGAVAWAVENGVTTGTSDTTFSPDTVCSRGHIVTFLNRSLAK